MKYIKREESILVIEIIKPHDLEKLKKRFPKIWIPIPVSDGEKELAKLAKIMRQKPKGGGYGI